MSKRTLMMVVALVAALALTATGTLAFLTDTDSDVNVMTLGNVDITQLENGLADSGFKNGQPLYPAYYEDEIDWKTSNGVVDKEVTVENTGASDAFVRTWFAFEAGDMTFDEFEKNILLNLNIFIIPLWHIQGFTVFINIILTLFFPFFDFFGNIGF